MNRLELCVSHRGAHHGDPVVGMVDVGDEILEQAGHGFGRGAHMVSLQRPAELPGADPVLPVAYLPGDRVFVHQSLVQLPEPVDRQRCARRGQVACVGSDADVAKCLHLVVGGPLAEQRKPDFGAGDLPG